MAFTPEQVLTELRKVIHPERNQDIVSLGMVEGLAVDGNTITFKLIYSGKKDPFEASIRKACIRAISTGVDPRAGVKIHTIIAKASPTPPKETLPGVKNILAIASGKGGVGKSTVAANLAVALAKKGYRVGLIDADIFGPSIPKMFGMENTRPLIDRAEGIDWIVPVENYGVKLLSIGFFIEPDDALVWRGPMATNALKQMINQGRWGDLDYILVDLPPGTSDIHLTLVQEVPVTGAIIVSTPQEVALADAVKGIMMFRTDRVNVPVLGLVENMAWFSPPELPDRKYYIFGNKGCGQLAQKYKAPLLGQIPVVESICTDGDKGTPSVLDEKSAVGAAFMNLAENVVRQVEIRHRELKPTRKVEIISRK